MTKMLVLVVAVVAMVGFCAVADDSGNPVGRDSAWREGPTKEWFVNWDKALAEARKTGKTMFVLKTGDWSSVHGDLRKQVLQEDKFLEFASKNLVLVYLNDAKSRPLGREQRKHNWFITDILAYGNASQKLRLFSPDGNEIESTIDCREQLDAFLSKLERALAERRTKSVALEAKRLFSEGYDKVSSEFFLKNDLFATSTNEFKMTLTGIAGGKSRQNGSEGEFVLPGNEIEIPYGTSAKFRVEYDVPKGFKVQFSVYEKRDPGNRDPYRLGYNCSRWCTGKGVAYTFLSLVRGTEDHRVKNVGVRIATEPALDGLPYGWATGDIPVNMNFMAESDEQKVNRPAVSKYVPKGSMEESALARLRERRKQLSAEGRLSRLEARLSADDAVVKAQKGDARGFYQLAILYAKKASEYNSTDTDRTKSLATSDKCLAKAVDMGYGNALLLRAIDIAHQNLFQTKYCGRHRHANDWYRCAGMDACGMEGSDLDKNTMLVDAFTNRTVVAEVIAAFDRAAKAGVTNALFFASYITNDLASSAAFKLRKRAEEAHESARIDAEVDVLLNGRTGIKPATVEQRDVASAKETGTTRATSSSAQTLTKDDGTSVAQLERQFSFDEAVRLASKGDGAGLYSLALHYATGQEVAQDGKRAAKYLEKAIDAKNANAALIKALVMEDDLKGLEAGANLRRGSLLNMRRAGTADETPYFRIRKYTGHAFWVFTFTLPPEHGEGWYATNDTAVAIVRSAYKKAVDLGCPSAKEEEARFERHVKRIRDGIRAEEAEKQAWIDKVNANARLAQEFLGEPPEMNPVYDKFSHAAKRDRGSSQDDVETERRYQRQALLQIQETLRKNRLEREKLQESREAK